MVALPALFAAVVALAGGACFLLGEGVWVFGCLLLLLAAFVFLSDRERFWRVACERCRGRRVDEVRATKPRLGSTTIIDF